MLLFCNFFPDTDTNLNFGAFYDPSWAMITNPWRFFGQYMLTVKSPFIGDLLCCGINNFLQNILLFCWRFILIMLNKILIAIAPNYSFIWTCGNFYLRNFYLVISPSFVISIFFSFLAYVFLINWMFFQISFLLPFEWKQCCFSSTNDISGIKSQHCRFSFLFNDQYWTRR